MMRNFLETATNRRVALAVISALAAALIEVSAARAAVPIDACPYTISAPGDYVLTADLTCASDGIDIKTSNVKLLLDGHTITGPDNGTQVGINSCAQPTQTGCSTGAGQLRNIRIEGPGLIRYFLSGIMLTNVTESQIRQLVVAFNFYGITATHGMNLQFKENVVTQTFGDGLSLSDQINDEIQQNEISGNTGYLFIGGGICYLFSIPKEECFFFNFTGNAGISILGGSGNHIYNNNVDANDYNGIYIQSDKNQVHDNTVFGNLVYGIIVDTSSSGNVIRNNTAEGNSVNTTVGPGNEYDLVDENPNCGTNTWDNNTFFAASPPTCIHARRSDQDQADDLLGDREGDAVGWVWVEPLHSEARAGRSRSGAMGRHLDFDKGLDLPACLYLPFAIPVGTGS